MQLLRPQHWKDYELIDSGDYEKLERFGKYIIRRPEPQAVWRKSLPEKEWEDAADATFFSRWQRQRSLGTKKWNARSVVHQLSI